MFAFPDDLVTRHLTDFGAHTRPELAFLLSVVREGDRIFDLGAHIGTFTVPLAKRVGPSGRVLAIEGVAETCALAMRNVALNDVADRVQIRNVIVASPGTYEAVGAAGNTGATFFRESSTGVDAAVTLDELVAETFVPDVLKIDLEGLEARVLLPSLMVRERKPVMYVEVSPALLERAGASVDVLARFFDSAGYRMFRNVGARNAVSDSFDVAKLRRLEDGGLFFDVLAIHQGDPRLHVFDGTMT